MNFWKCKISIDILNREKLNEQNKNSPGECIFKPKKWWRTLHDYQTPENKNLQSLRQITKFRQCVKRRKASFPHTHAVSWPSKDHLLPSFNTRWCMWNAHHVCLYCKPFSLCQLLKREIIETELWSFNTIWFEIWKSDKLPKYGSLELAMKRAFNTINNIRIFYTFHEKKSLLFLLFSCLKIS